MQSYLFYIKFIYLNYRKLLLFCQNKKECFEGVLSSLSPKLTPKTQHQCCDSFVVTLLTLKSIFLLHIYWNKASKIYRICVLEYMYFLSN